MALSRRIYLDNAATSWPKPHTVYDAVDRCQRELGAPAGRSAYAEADQVSQAVDRARRGLARLLAVDDPRRVVFAFNGTDALNLAIHGALSTGDHVITSAVEHNSVLRPLRALMDAGQIEVTYVGCDAAGVVCPDDFRAAVRRETRLIALTHVSNVTGAVQPVAEVGRIAREAEALMLVDAAQSLGHLPCSPAQIGADLVAAPGHKGLLGPLGTGLLYVGPGVEERLRSVRQGGTGTQSETDRQPASMPDKYEAGNLNVPGIVGLDAALEYLHARGIETLAAQARELTARLVAGLSEIAGVRLYGPKGADQRVALVSFTIEGYDPQEVAAMLDASYRIQVRAGMHCAPRMHEALETIRKGGTVRLSLGPFNTLEDVDTALRAIGEIAAEAEGA